MILLGFMNENNNVVMLCSVRQDQESLEESVKVLQYASDSNRTILSKSLNLVTNISNGNQSQSALEENRLLPFKQDQTHLLIQGVKEKIKMEEYNKRMQRFRASMFKELEETSRQSMCILENSRSSTFAGPLKGFQPCGKENDPPVNVPVDLENDFFSKAVDLPLLSSQKTPTIFRSQKSKWG